MKKSVFILLSLLLALLSQNALAVEIEASVDRNPVNVGESFQLTFSASESPDDDPDFSPLEQDFEILSQSQNHQARWINGDFSRTVEWTLILMPKRAGRLTIPAIAFGKDRSRPLTMNIVQQAVQNEDRDLFLTAEVDAQSPYVQSQVVYTLRFYRKVAIAQASMDEPELADAVIERLGEDKNFDKAINGVRYRVTERKYAIFPQQSGRQTLKPVSLTAEVISGRRSRFGFFGSQMTLTKRLQSPAITLQVKPIPADYQGHWLPAEQVVLQDGWSDDSLTVKVGEPLTRTLTILAKGVTDSQLPKLWPDKALNGLKSYPDQPVLREQQKPDGVIAFREEKIALIPSKPGDYELPAIELHWFNTRTEQQEVLALPAVKIHAIAAAQNNLPPVNTTLPAETAPVDETKTVNCPATETPEPQHNDTFWPVVAAFLACGWLLTLFYCLRQSRKKPEEPAPENHQQDLKAAVKALKKACFANDPQAAKQALLNWGQQAFGAGGLSEIKNHCEARLRDQIDALMASLYAPDAREWQGKALYQAFVESNARQKIHSKAPVTELKSLFRQQ